MTDKSEAFLARRRQIGTAYYHRNKAKVLAKCRERYAENGEKQKRYSKTWRADNPEHTMLLACRKSAKQRGHECSLTVEDIMELTAPMTCSMTGLPLEWRKGPWKPSLDRVDNSIGYMKSNVRLVCWAFNNMRGKWDDETLLTVAEGFVSMQRTQALKEHNTKQESE